MKKCWIFSLDALGGHDAELFETLPNFKRVIENGVYRPKLRSVYPSLTYPAHATIVTGRYPASHGIVNNRKRQPEREIQDWFWSESEIRGDTLIRAAKRAKRTVCMILWPVGAGAPVRANIAEIFPTRPTQSQVTVSLKNSTVMPLLDCERRFGKLRKGIDEPELDNYAEACCMHWIDKYDPDLLFVHFVDVDSQKHHHGPEDEEVKNAIRRIDARIGRILEKRDSRPDKENIDLVFLSDHAQLATPNMLYPLDELREAGFLNAKGASVISSEVYAHSAGGSCYFYAPYALSFDARRRFDRFLETYGRSEGIERIYTDDEAALLGADPLCIAMAEAKEGYQFSEFLSCSKHAEKEKASHLGNHGFNPYRDDYYAVFFAEGPSYRKGARNDSIGSILSIAPTLSKALGLSLRDAEGEPMTDFLVD